MNSIRGRLLFWLLIPLTIVAFIVSIETFLSARKISNDLHDKTLLAAMLTVSENVVASNGTVLAEHTLKALTENLGDQFFYYVIGPNGAFVTGYSGYPRRPDHMTLEDGVPIYYDGVYQNSAVRVISMRQFLSGRELNGWITITTWQKTTQRTDLTFNLFGKSLIRLTALVLAAGMIVWLAVTFGLRPLRRLQQAIEKRTPNDLTPIKRPLPSELTGIVESMNDLFARVGRSKANRERFIADAAHQLRNPIAALKVQAEVALQAKNDKKRQEGISQIINVSNQTSSLVNKMLTNARANALEKENAKPFNLSETVLEAARIVAPQAIDRDQEFSINVKPDLIFKGDQLLIREAIINLLENASKYSPSHSEITLSLSSNNEGLMVSVSDEGAILQQDEFQRLCQPFHTNDAEKSGSGLGLAIASDLAKNHGGYLTIESVVSGKVKSINIILPLDH